MLPSLHFRTSAALIAVAAALLLTPAVASAVTYEVGPGRAYAQLTDVDDRVIPGDLVLVYGDATYAGDVRFTTDGAGGAPITIRGVPVNGKRPVISGGYNTIEVEADMYVLENLDITGGSARCYFHHGDEIVVRDTIVHDCPKQGILGADNDSGSLTLERVEVTRSGGGDRDHQIYMATDEVAHPGSVFRMVGCWIHDGNGGNNVKSRAERNEIYGNWIENAFYHELELIGPDPAGSVPESQAREDSDVVGNVLRKVRPFAVVRFGGDATGQSNGRYRFAYNTVLVTDDSAVFRLFDGIETLEAYGNVIHRAGGSDPVNVMRDVETEWVGGTRRVTGAGNWVTSGATNTPPEWTGTLTGADPGFMDLAGLDLRPSPTSPLKDAGPASTPTIPGHEFAGPPLPQTVEPAGRLPSAAPRPVDGPPDIGAYERGDIVPGGPVGGGGSPPPTGQPGGGGAVPKPGFTRRSKKAKLIRRGKRYIVDSGLSVRCPAAMACRASVRATAAGGRAGSARVKGAAGASKVLRFTLTSRARKYLLRRDRLRIRVSLRAVAGSSSATLKRTLVVTR